MIKKVGTAMTEQEKPKEGTPRQRTLGDWKNEKVAKLLEFCRKEGIQLVPRFQPTIDILPDPTAVPGEGDGGE